MSTAEYIVLLSVCGTAILLLAMSVWGGWAGKFYDRYRESPRVWQVLRLAGVSLSKNNCVRFVQAVSLVGIGLVAIGIFAATSEFMQNGEAANALLGKWAQSRPDGSTMVWEFTPTAVAFTLIDPSGEQAQPEYRTNVGYRKGERGEMYHVEAADTRHTLVMTIVMTGPDTALLDFAGMGPHELIRIQP